MDYEVIGKSIPRVDAFAKVLGKARYAEDFEVAGMCYGRLLRSPIPHGKITRLDVSKAERFKGVITVVTAKDAPPIRIGQAIMDSYILPIDGVVRYVGEPVAAVVARNEKIAEEALDLIEVEYEEWPAVFDVREVMTENPSVVLHPDLPKYRQVGFPPVALEEGLPNCIQHQSIEVGDVDKAFAEADLIVENEYTMPRISHAIPETNQSTAWWEPDGGLTVVATSQLSSPYQLSLAALYQIPPSKVRVVVPYKGCGFGSMQMPGLIDIVPLLAKKAGRPVKVSFTRQEQFVAGLHRGANVCHLKDGVKKDGRIIVRQAKIIMEAGAYSGSMPVIVWFCRNSAEALYNIPNFSLNAYGCYTNLPPAGAYRGFSAPELAWGTEQQIDIIAEKLGMPAVEVIKRNLLKEGDKNASGITVHDVGAEKTLDEAAKHFVWAPKKNGMDGYPWRTGKGIAVGCKSTIAGTDSNAIVKVKMDGWVEVYHSACEMGQGIDTVMAQIAAEEFKTSLNKVRIIRGDTAVTPWDTGTFSSRGTFHVGNAVIRACRDAKRQLFELAEPTLGTRELDIRDDLIHDVHRPENTLPLMELFTPTGTVAGGKVVEIAGHGSFLGQSEDRVVSHGYAAHAVEVAVNVETGAVKLLKMAVSGDCGRPINPKMVEQQLEGGMVQAIGPALMEALHFEKGRLTNPNFIDYRLPLITDIPPVSLFTTEIVSTLHADGPFGAKGIGEAPLVPMAPALANAVYDAVGVRIKEMPITREKILCALKAQGKH